MITQNLETLRQVSEPFSGTDAELQELIQCLDFELSKTKGAGLSAIQISIPYRVCIIRTNGKYNLYNARIIRAEQPFTFRGEGCLSMPGKFGNTRRFNIITVLNGDGKEIKFSGFDAVVVQHELNHWDGILFTDKEIKEGV